MNNQIISEYINELYKKQRVYQLNKLIEAISFNTGATKAKAREVLENQFNAGALRYLFVPHNMGVYVNVIQLKPCGCGGAE